MLLKANREWNLVKFLLQRNECHLSTDQFTQQHVVVAPPAAAIQQYNGNVFEKHEMCYMHHDIFTGHVSVSKIFWVSVKITYVQIVPKSDHSVSSNLAWTNLVA